MGVERGGAVVGTKCSLGGSKRERRNSKLGLRGKQSDRFGWPATGEGLLPEDSSVVGCSDLLIGK